MIGFVYLWRDRKKNKYYLGSHKGKENDGYISSSRWFNNAYDKRPQDFKRRIIERVYIGDITDIRKAELRWLNMIKLEELTFKYYNVKLAASGFDSITASRIAKVAMSDPIILEKHHAACIKAKNVPGERDRHRQRAILQHADPDKKKIHRQGCKNGWSDPQLKRKRVAAIAKANTGSHWINNGTVNLRLKPTETCPEGWSFGMYHK